jgi:hypothetical protein
MSQDSEAQARSFLQDLLEGKAPHIRQKDISSIIDPQLLLLGKIHEQLTTQMVRFLLDPALFPNKGINDLCHLFWQLVGSGVSRMAVTETVPSIHMLAIRDKVQDPLVCTVMVPASFLNLVLEDPWMQLGALVFTASQAKDIWNKKLDANIPDRARTQEAEFLRTAQHFPNFKANDYQVRILKIYPPESLVRWQYSSEPFNLKEAQARFQDPSGQGIHEPSNPFEFKNHVNIPM